MERVVCAFCGKSVTPKPGPDTSVLVKYRCDACDSLIAAYANDYDEKLRFGGIFDRYALGNYSPKLPPYVKRIEPKSE